MKTLLGLAFAASIACVPHAVASQADNLMSVADDLMGTCGGKGPVADAACDRLHSVEANLKQMGWRYGRFGDRCVGEWHKIADVGCPSDPKLDNPPSRPVKWP